MKWKGDRRKHHAHQCETCGLLWEHDAPTSEMIASVEDGTVTDKCYKAYELGHTCPVCGTEQFWCYKGNRPATCQHGGGKPTRFYERIAG